MAYYITSFNGVDLQATCGLVTPGVSGVHDLVEPEISKLWLPGSDTAHVTVLRREMRTINLYALVVGDDHSDLVSKLALLRGYLFPDTDFHPLVVADRADQRIMALCLGWPVGVDKLPGDIAALELQIPFLAYSYWEDATARSAKVATSFLSFRQATFEHSALDGWAALVAGTPTLQSSGAYSGTRCMKVVTTAGGTDGAKTPDAGITGVTAGLDYSLQMRLKGEAGGETVTAAIRWYTSGDVYLSEDTANFNLTAAWAQYKLEGATAPVTAAKASVQVRDAHASTFYVDEVCLEEAATCGDFITPYDANTTIYNGGQRTCYPEYTCHVTDTLATGLWFETADQRFIYQGGLVDTDELLVDTDQQLPDVELNGTRDWANVNRASVFPPLAVGFNTVELSDPTKYWLAVSARWRHE